ELVYIDRPEVKHEAAFLALSAPPSESHDAGTSVDVLLDVCAELVECLLPLVPDQTKRREAVHAFRRIRRVLQIAPLNGRMVMSQRAIAVAAIERGTNTTHDLHVLLRH